MSIIDDVNKMKKGKQYTPNKILALVDGKLVDFSKDNIIERKVIQEMIAEVKKNMYNPPFYLYSKVKVDISLFEEIEENIIVEGLLGNTVYVSPTKYLTEKK